MKALLFIPVLGMALHSCGPSAVDGGFDSANPAAKMYAIERAVQQGDRAAIRRIVEQLDSDDPAVRSLAIAALKRLTGETLGYRDYDPLPLRREAIARWERAIMDQQFFSDPDQSPAAPRSAGTEACPTAPRAPSGASSRGASPPPAGSSDSEEANKHG